MEKHTFHRILIGAAAVLAAITFSSVASAEMTENIKIPFNAIVNNECLGEAVQLTGELHLVISTQQTGNGLRISQHSNPVGVSGTGLDSGESFRGLGVTKLVTFIDGDPPYDVSFVNNFTLKGIDDAKTARIHQNVHVSVNADGEITSSVDNLKTSCK